MIIEIDPLTGSPIIPSKGKDDFTVTDDSLSKSDELSKVMDKVEAANEADTKSTDSLNTAIIPPTAAKVNRSQLARINAILKNGMDSQQAEKAMVEIKNILCPPLNDLPLVNERSE